MCDLTINELWEKYAYDDFGMDSYMSKEAFTKAIAEVIDNVTSGGWRSIHSILPSKEDYYLVYYIDNYEEIKKAYYDAGAKRFIGMGNRVTHWMPLPEKPAVL